MADPFHHVKAGQDFEPSASFHNTTVDVLRAYRRGELGPTGPDGKRRLTLPSLEITVRNDTAVDLTAGDVVSIQGTPLVSATEHAALARRRPFMPGTVPAAARDPIAILSVAIPAGEYGLAVISGLAVTKVDASEGEFCSPVPGQTGWMACGDAGPCRILWRDGTGYGYGSGSGGSGRLVTAVVLVGSGGSGGTGGGGCFFAWVVSRNLIGGQWVYNIAEIEGTPGNPTTYRAKAGGRAGVAYRTPSAIYDPPPIPIRDPGTGKAQAVWACPSDTEPGTYTITPWGGQRRDTEEQLVWVEHHGFPDPLDCSSWVVANLHFFGKDRTAARDRCRTAAAAGEAETPLG